MKLSKVIKISLGSAAAIYLAGMLGLSYATSAGIITLLTIQDTVKETIAVSAKRIMAFVVALVISFAVFNLIGYNPAAFGVFLLIFVTICYRFRLGDAIAMNAVLSTHYLLEQNMRLGLIVNEALLLIIGAGIGTLLNLFMEGKAGKIRQEQKAIETDLKTILTRMAYYIVREDKSDYTGTCFNGLEEKLLKGEKYAYENMQNTFFGETQYFIKYMQMRRQQCQILKRIYAKIVKMSTVPEQAADIAEFINTVSDTFSETNNAKALIEQEQNLLAKYSESRLPSDREEFENRAVLYMILNDFEEFLKVKAEFSESLTREQKELYWK